MPVDEEIIQDAYYIRDLINHSNKTKELSEIFFRLLETEVAVVLNIISIGQKERIKKIIDPLPVRKIIIEKEEVPLKEGDYAKLVGIIEGLRWLRGEIDGYINKANDEDTRKAKEEEK